VYGQYLNDGDCAPNLNARRDAPGNSTAQETPPPLMIFAVAARVANVMRRQVLWRCGRARSTPEFFSEARVVCIIVSCSLSEKEGSDQFAKKNTELRPSRCKNIKLLTNSLGGI
jgi:hypothetical protein